MGKFIMNGVEYTSSPMNGFPPLIYSDEEREIGVWRDGKPLYQKVMLFSQGVTLSTNRADINVNIPIDLIVYASAYRNSDGFYNILKASQGNNTGEISIRLESGSFSADAVLIQYTKTTDTVGSGRYTTYGGLTHHYSTTEQVIGTWIDGKPIYEKTIHVTSVVANDNWQNIEDLSVKLLIDFECIAYTSGGESGDQTSFRGDKNAPQIQAVSSTGYICYALISGTSVSGLYITARYTKTTD